MKERITIFEAIEQANRDLGEVDLLYSVCNEDGSVSLLCSKSSYAVHKVYDKIGFVGSVYSGIKEISTIKKTILSRFVPTIAQINYYTYRETLEIAKKRIAKVKNTELTMQYLKDRYGFEFKYYPNTHNHGFIAVGGDEWTSSVVYPNLICITGADHLRFFGFRYFNLYFDGINISEKSLKAYCRKMDKVITRLRCIVSAFGNYEKEYCREFFFNQIEIKKSGFGDWIIKFPYRDKAFLGKSHNQMKKLMDFFRYKDSNFCIWRASTPEEFEMMRLLLL